jgi:hypothetical protein
MIQIVPAHYVLSMVNTTDITRKSFKIKVSDQCLALKWSLIWMKNKISNKLLHLWLVLTLLLNSNKNKFLEKFLISPNLLKMNSLNLSKTFEMNLILKKFLRKWIKLRNQFKLQKKKKLELTCTQCIIKFRKLKRKCKLMANVILLSRQKENNKFKILLKFQVSAHSSSVFCLLLLYSLLDLKILKKLKLTINFIPKPNNFWVKDQLNQLQKLKLCLNP